jgi:signal transduction histidine kinase
MAVVVGVAVVAAVSFLAHAQPWLGLRLAPAQKGLGVIAHSSQGPSAEIPEGLTLTGVSGKGDRLQLKGFDLTVEPDGAMGDFANYWRFLARQDRLAAILRSGEVTFMGENGRAYTVQPTSIGRPLADLPPDFWVQCFVGLVAWLISVAVYAFRPGEASARFLLLSGAATLLFAPAAAVYTTRELAVPGGLLRWASDLNFFGGSLFAASFVGLLLVYPRRIGPRWVGPAVVVLFVLWFVAQQVGLFASMTFARRFLVMLGVLATFALAGWHWRTSGRDPLARAKLQWFLLSWVVGTSAFALFILLPQTFGVDTSPIQGYAFLLFLQVYAGLAMGILRYRLFDLGDWWRRVVVWMLTVLILVLLDMLFLFGLGLSVGTSLAVTLLLCGLIWIPVRGWLWQHFADRRTGRTRMDLFRRVTDITLAPDPEQQASAWRELMRSLFEPLEIRDADPPFERKVALHDDGLRMDLPHVGPLGGVRLSYARGGRSLFRPADVALAEEVAAMLQHGFESLTAYRKGVLEERGRIARDIHDNIGASLLGALHSPDAERKDLRIRESLTDLRQVINEEREEGALIGTLFADLRLETAERVEAAGMRLVWCDELAANSGISRKVTHAVRSIIREAASNAIRHAQAKEIKITVEVDSAGLRIEVRDNGKGFDPDQNEEGHGLVNIGSRVASLDGAFDLESGHEGTTIKIRLPFQVTG